MWNPTYQVHIDHTERVQKVFTRYLTLGASGFSYRNEYQGRLEYFELVSLSHRRGIHDPVFFCKLLLRGLDSPRFNSRWQLSKPFDVLMDKFNSPFSGAQIVSNYNSLDSRVDLDIHYDSLPRLIKTKL